MAVGNSRGEFLAARAGRVTRLGVQAGRADFASGTIELTNSLAPGDSGGPVYADLDGQRVIIGLVSGTRDAAAEHQCDAPAGPDMAMSYTAMPGILEVIDREVPAAEYHTP